MALHTLVLLALIAMVAAHYNLKSPMAYNPVDCNRPDCSGPCPPIWTTGNGKARNTPSNPSALWKRGEVVNIEWHRNNHEGGYYRRSLVPVKHMFDAAWHKRMAFEWGCWTQNRFFCGKKDECGTDKDGFAYRNAMKVPTVYPDGDYVFAMVWFGGLHWRRQKALFSDYYTCAYVRIEGGALEKSHTPDFIVGTNHREVAPGTCRSTSAFAGECGGEPCDSNKPVEDVPGVFRNGNTPPDVLLEDLDSNAMTIVPDNSLLIETAAMEKKAEVEMVIEEKRDAQWAKEESNANAIPTPSSLPSPSYSPEPKTIEVMVTVTPAPSAADKCANISSVPQKPTGAWGPRNSALWESKRVQWWKWFNYCNPRKICSCWD